MCYLFLQWLEECSALLEKQLMLCYFLSECICHIYGVVSKAKVSRTKLTAVSQLCQPINPAWTKKLKERRKNLF